MHPYVRLRPWRRQWTTIKNGIMKRLILLAAFVFAAGTLAAQNCITVNSEKLFKSLDAYNAALEKLDSLASAYQKEVDARFAEVEELYNAYMLQKRSLSSSTQQSRENAILTKEKEAQQYQESIFGNEGTLMKQRVELIQPIQKQVFAAIEAYAAEVGADVVIDSANNPTLLFNSPRADHTQQLIERLKTTNK